MNDSETAPVFFNCIKHHLAYIAEKACNGGDPDDLRKLSKELMNIGHSPLDLYTGTIPASGIISEIAKQLNADGRYARNDFGQWIRNNKGYCRMTIPDGSAWTLRLREKNKNYIHIHPARDSKNVIRVHASMLKSAVVCAARTNAHKEDEPHIAQMNFLRTEYLALPPLRKMSDKFLHLYRQIKRAMNKSLPA